MIDLILESKNLIKSIRPAPWGVEKVNGIDLTRDFYWVDDDFDGGSVASLVDAGMSSRLVVASTDQCQLIWNGIQNCLRG
jgi:hypothetical protein